MDRLDTNQLRVMLLSLGLLIGSARLFIRNLSGSSRQEVIRELARVAGGA